jgi:lipopolysaccharide export system permease protein
MLKNLLPQKIDRYLIQELMGPFIGGLVFFMFLLLMFQALRLADSFIVQGVQGIMLVKIIGLMLVTFLPFAIPVAFLIAIVLAFSRLSADSELVAMKACGMSLYRLSRSALMISIGVALVSLFLNMDWVPNSERALRKSFIRLANTKAVSVIKEGTFTTGFFDLLIYADKVDRKTNQLKKVFIYDERESKNPVTVVASEGEIVPIKKKSDLGTSLVLKLYKGTLHTSNAILKTFQKIEFDEYQLFLKIDAGSDGIEEKPSITPHRELLERVKREEQAHPGGHYQRELMTEFWRRIAIALTPLFFVFLGMSYGSFKARTGKSASWLYALITIIGYWSLQSVFYELGKTAQIHPLFAGLTPVLILAVFSTLLFKKSYK